MATYSVGSQPGDTYPDPQTAANTAASGSFLEIRNEVYAGSLATPLGKQFYYMPHPDNPAGTFWTMNATGQASGIRLRTNDEAIGFEVYGATGDAVTAASFSLTAYKVDGFYIHDVGGRGLYYLKRGSRIRNGLIVDTGGPGIYHADVGANIYNVVVLRATGYGIFTSHHPATPSQVSWSTVVGTLAGAGFSGDGFREQASSLVMYNCISAFNANDGFRLLNLGYAWNCVSHGNGGIDFNHTTPPYSCSTADPLFKAIGSDNLRVELGSPAIGRCAARYGVTDDLDGNPRPDPVTSSYDAGAYQYIVTDGGMDSVTVEDAGTILYSGLDLEQDPFGTVSTSGTQDIVMIVTIALFADARASDDDIPPDGTQNRRGYWADTYEDDDWSTGSLLWLLDRSVLTQDQRVLARSYCEQALEFMVDAGLAASVEVEVRDNERQRLDVFVTISQDDGSDTTITYADLWEAVK